MNDTDNKPVSHFIEQIVRDDLKANTHQGRVHTRFPPEPNGYLHIGHAKAALVSFNLAKTFNGQCNLRFDDTNPCKEEQHYVEAIQRDLLWLGFQWSGEVRYASSYFETFYQWAVHLVQKDCAYVCDLSAEQARTLRGTLTEAGENSPFRNRSIDENLSLLARMRSGDFEEGACVLRAKIDMTHPNMNMRDPILYRIRKAHHHQTGDRWCIYPSYDFAHGQEDAIEGITHSLCSLEFADHRPLYNWFLDRLPVPHRPAQYEFARLQPDYTITSKRKLKRLVDEGHVDGWDDPRMPTLAGLRRRGVPAAAIRQFCELVGLTRANSTVETSVLEFTIRENLNAIAPRAMAVLNPVKIVLTNYPQEQVEWLDVAVHPQDASMGTRSVPFSRHLYIDRADFADPAPRKWKRLAPGAAVRLRGAYVIQFEKALWDENGNLTELHGQYDKDTLGKNPENYKAKGVIHWVSAEHALDAEIRLYDRLFNHPKPDADDDFTQHINPDSLQWVTTAKLEPSLADAQPEQAYQFEREGYFCRDNTIKDKRVFNRTISLRDTWAKITKNTQ